MTPLTVKFARISDQANNHALQSIKLYRMYLDAQGTPDGWTPQKGAHKTEMFNFLSETFPAKNVDDNA